MIEKLERHLESIDGVKRVAILTMEREQRIPPVHLSDLFPDIKEAAAASATAIKAQSYTPEQSDTSEKPPAISYGGTLALEPDAPQTLTEVLQRACFKAPGNGMKYITGEGTEAVQTYPQLLNDAQRVLAGLRKLGLKPGDSVFFQFASNQNFVSAFWGCILGGFLPTLVSAAPVYNEMNAAVKKLYNSWNLLGKPLVLTDQALAPQIRGLEELWQTAELKVQALEPFYLNEPNHDWYPAKAHDLVLNLLTSGSTGMPKCVQHNHSTVLSNVRGTIALNKFSENEISLNWMPLDHVGGIVMFHILDVYLACQQINAKIDSFIANPLNWLHWIDKYRVTKTWAPNFAFSLVNDSEEKIKEGRWDLSSLSHAINGAEAVVAKTAHRFLNILARHGLHATVMRPAFGMSEISSAIVFSDLMVRGYDEAGVLSFDKNSLLGTLRLVQSDSPESVTFTEVGPPIPGVTVRIVDRANQVVHEDQIGRVQVKGLTTMVGYYKNPEANSEVFVGDGWFHTGDLGFLHQGRLTITGREKDVIIINGKNFHNYEIEALIEEVQGVEVTYAAACSITDTSAGRDELAVFFTPADTDFDYRMNVAQDIRRHIIRKMGIDPAYIIPVEKEDFPKTSSGKIERAELGKSLANGRFAPILKRMDIYFENDRTLPDWSYETIWIPHDLPEAEVQPMAGSCLLFADALGLAEELAAQWNGSAILVEAGERFGKTGNGRYQINPSHAEHYELLFEALAVERIRPDHIIHQWNYTGIGGGITDLHTLRESQYYSSYSLLFLTQALAKQQDHPVALTVISTDMRAIEGQERIAFEKSTIDGIVKTIPHEFPWIKCKQVDFTLSCKATHVLSIIKELQLETAEAVVAYRDGTRLVQRLKKIDLLEDRKQDVPFVRGGLYLITGGLGGIGKRVAALLLEQYQANLLLIGRIELPSLGLEQRKHDTGLITGTAERVNSFEELQQLAELSGGSVSYHAADLCGLTGLQTIVAEAESQLNLPISGVIHLAGIIQEYPLADLTQELLEEMYDSKVFGSFVLHQLLQERPDSLYISASSARTLAAGMTVGSYCSANGFVEHFSQYQRLSSSVKSYCFSWSMWEEVGMSRELIIKDALKSRGYMPISPERGLYSYLCGLMCDKPLLFVGLDGSKKEIREFTGSGAEKQVVLHAYFSAEDRNFSRAKLRNMATEFQQAEPASPEMPMVFIQLDEMPLLPSGEADRDLLASIMERASLETAYVAPRTDVELKLADIWKKLLQAKNVSVHDDFFAMGGHSLKATQLLSAVREVFGTEILLQSLFANPTLAGLAERIEGNVSAMDAAAGRIKRVSHGNIFPMSHAQKRQWFLYQLEPENPYYNNTLSLRLSGNLDIEALNRSLQAIVDRHATLRSSFQLADDLPIQIIEPTQLLEISLIDLTQGPSAEREVEVRRLAKAEAKTPFHLETGSPIRASILRMGAEDHLLLVSIHHIVSDGWSIGVLIRELAGFYSAYVNRNSPDLPELPIQYSDFTLWQQEWLAGDVLKEQLDYWKGQFTGALPLLELPTDFQRPLVQRYKGKTQERSLSPELAQGLRQLTQHAGGTLFMTLLSAFSALLYRYTGQEDLIIGSAIANRNRAEVEQLIGFFVNTLALRIDVSSDPTFMDLLERVKATTLGAYDNQDVPFELLIDELKLERDASRQPLFQVLFILQNAPMKAMKMERVAMSLRIEDNDTSKFDLAVHVFEMDEGLNISLEYNTDLFRDETIARFLAHYQTLLEGIVLSPDRRLSQLPMLTASEQRTILKEWNRTEREFPHELCIQEIFAMQAAKSPNAPAIVAQGQEINYRELDRRAELLAGHLQTEGVGPDVTVGVLMDCSIEMIVAILGIIKAGGAYVPIDPAYPQARIDYLLDNTNLRLVLTRHPFLHLIRSAVLPRFLLDGNWEEQAQGAYDAAASVSGSQQLAYLNYTSGSTGTPKGVLIPHQAVVRLVCNTDFVQLNADDRILQISNYAFDAFTFELWGTLLNGGRLILADRDTILSMERLAEAFKTYRITIGFLTVPLFNRLMEEYPESIQNFKVLLVGGEALSVNHMRKGLDNLPDGLFSAYGPTENTTFSCVHKIRDIAPDAAAIPLGKPIANSQAYILDTHLNPVPVGVHGEIYVGGKGLALGYLGDPERTAQMFIRHPFSHNPEDRLYKTGDRAYWLTDGTIEFLGRIDNQVKIRGYRVECGEIEAALMQNEALKECAVIPKTVQGGNKRLVAYVVARSGTETVNWRAFLQQSLPDYMIPSYYVSVDKLPLTNNGKVDKRLLPEPDLTEIETSADDTAPRNDAEQVMADVWQSLLGVKQIGIHENFFELGGDSIIVIQMVGRLAKEGYRIQPKLVFENQTIAQLSLLMESETKHAEIDQSPVTGPVPLTPIQLWFFGNNFENSHHWNLPTLLCFDRALHPATLESALQHIINHHDALRMRFAKTDGGWLQHNPGLGEKPVLEVFDFKPLTEGDRETQMLAVSNRMQASLSFEEGPMLRAALFQWGEQSDRLFIAAHHLIVDGISWRVIVEDLLQAMEQAEAGKPAKSANKTTSFKLWAEALSDYAQSDEIDRQMAYWQQVLTEIDLGLPFAPLTEPNTEANAETISMTLGKQETSLLLTEASKAYFTEINDLLLVSLLRAFQNLTGQPALAITLEGHGREDVIEGIDLSRTVGWFTTSFPVSLKTPNDADLGMQIKSIKEILRNVPQKGFGFGLLKYISQDTQAKLFIRQSKGPQISFNYLGQLDYGSEGVALLIADERNGHVHSPSAAREHLIDVYGYVAAGELHIHFTINRQIAANESVRNLAATFKAELETVIAHCLQPENGGFTPSCFPLVGLTQQQADELPSNTEDVYPLSPMQQGMLFHALLDTGSMAYFGQVQLTLENIAELDLYEQAWNQVIERHPILRTCFRWEGLKEPVQIVLKSFPVQMAHYDVTGQTEEERRAFLQDILQADRRQGFELDEPKPSIRFKLLSLDQTRCLLIFSFHHILIDGWSLFQLVGDSLAAYRALADGTGTHKARTRPYKDFIIWLMKQDKQMALSFWTKYLKGIQSATALPALADKETSHLAEVLQEGITLSASLTQAIEALARSEKITMSTMIQTAWGLLLSLYSGMHDVVFGVTVSGRPASMGDVDKMVGLFINTLPMRVRITPGQTMQQLLQDVQQMAIELREFEYSLLPDIQAVTNIPANQPLFNSIVVVENYPIETMTVHGVKIQDILSYEQTNYDLTLVIVPGQCLQLRISYQAQQFATAQMKRLMRHLEKIIAVIVQQPLLKASELTVLSEEEKANILQEWSFTAFVDTVHPDQEEIYAGVNDPSAQTEIYILDPKGYPLPVGIVGEICIGSADLKRHSGSWSEWMMENAIPHPFGKRTGEKLYKTGDLGMWKEDGTILIVELI